MANAQEQYVATAIAAFGQDDWQRVLDALPVPVYTTDPEGAVTYWNQACVDFAGRVPQLGSDRWCVTWQLYTTTGEFLPHEQCPMAEAVKSKREVRDKVAIALRPDGTRRAFRAYPTPLFDQDGSFTGAANLLLDISDEQVEALTDQAARCRRLSRSTLDPEASAILSNMASDYDETAKSLKAPA